MLNRIPRSGEIYKHFKDNLYQIITIAIDSETREQMVVYQALYGNFKTYVRPLSMFISEVDHVKYPNVKQKYRFELIDIEDYENNKTKIKEDSKIKDETKLKDDIELTNDNITSYDYKIKVDNITKNINLQDDIKVKEDVNTILMDFLDAKSYEQKLNIVISNRKQITDRLINDMAASIDCSIDEGPIEERTNALIYSLKTISRFEFNRLR